MSLVSTEVSLQQTRDAIGSEDTTFLLFPGPFPEKIRVSEGPEIRGFRILSSGFYLDSSLWGVIGSNTLGADTTIFSRKTIDSPNNLFRDRLNFDYFIDSASTSGTINYSLGSGTIGPGQQIQTTAIFLDDSNVRFVDSAQLVNATTSGTFDTYFSANGGTTWIKADSTTTSAFTGTDRSYDLRAKFVNPSSGTITFGEYSVQYLLGN